MVAVLQTYLDVYGIIKYRMSCMTIHIKYHAREDIRGQLLKLGPQGEDITIHNKRKCSSPHVYVGLAHARSDIIRCLYHVSPYNLLNELNYWDTVYLYVDVEY